MGMIFRTDTYDFISANAVNSLTMNAVAGVIENPELLTTYSWRRVLPTVALSLKFSSAERLSIGDWKDAKGLSDEAPITLRYAEGKEGMSRICKMICAEVFTQLNSNNVQTFDEVSAQQWEAMAEEAREKVQAKPLDVEVLWRNPDIGRTSRVFKAKSLTFPISKRQKRPLPLRSQGSGGHSTQPQHTTSRAISKEGEIRY